MAMLAISLAGCEYGGPAEGAVSPPSQSETSEQRSFQENVEEVAGLLKASPTDPGMPSEAEPTGELSIELAPGDYMVKSACAGGHGANLAIVQGESAPLTMLYTCDSVAERFVRHAGGPIAISATAPSGKPAAAGVTVQPNTDTRASELEDLKEWSAQQLQPEIPGQRAGSTLSDTVISYGMTSLDPGRYELHFVCEGPPQVQFSMSRPLGAEVLAPVRVPCNGDVFKTSVELVSQDADFRIDSGDRTVGRYAFRLVPSA
ncbi:hypothetical protein M1E17_05385 [Arthrobacter sp. D1-29]